MDGVTGNTRELFVFDDVRKTAYTEGEKHLNVLALSRNLPDPRGGYKGAGGLPDVVAATKSITLSSRRQDELNKA
jgi:hypothetical protein